MMRFLVREAPGSRLAGVPARVAQLLRKRARGTLVARGRRAADPMALQAVSAAPAAALAAQSCEDGEGVTQKLFEQGVLLEGNVCDSGPHEFDQTIENL